MRGGILKRVVYGADQGSVALIAVLSGFPHLLGWIGAIALWGTLMVLLWRRAWGQSGWLARATDIVGALVCSAILAFGIARGIPEQQPRNVWGTDMGHQLHAGFVASCHYGAYGRDVACECLFEKLTGRPPGRTPSGFTMLTQSIRYATQRGDPRWMRQPAAAAVEACRRDA
ncbi:MAG: hypothetical protein ACJ76L_10080 [Conexibacter sp.]